MGPFDQYEGEWTPDGRALVVRQTATPETGRDIWIVQPSTGEAREFLKTRYNERSMTVSPDGHRLAFVSDESGIDEVYLRDFPGPGGKWQVSSGGGTEPAWRGDGSELFFRGVRGMMVAPLETRPTYRPGTARPLFEDVYTRNPDHTNYGVNPDGQVFFMARTVVRNASIVLVLNWFEELRARMATSRPAVGPDQREDGINGIGRDSRITGCRPCEGQPSAVWLPYMASKTTIYLDPDDYRRLKLLARRQGRPTAELVREAVAEYARRHAPAAAPRSVGAARTRRRDLSERAEDLLGGIGERA